VTTEATAREAVADGGGHRAIPKVRVVTTNEVGTLD
jgi:hypothetical protein